MLIYRKTQAVLIGCLLAMVLLSCSGTGGAADSVATTYGAGGGTTSANTGSGGISAIDILEKSNADDMEAVVAILSQTGGGGSGGGSVNYELSSTVVLNSDDIGLPADGRVILTISGDGMDDIELTVSPDADGTVSFEIPAIQTGTTVTVSMDVQNAGNNTVCIGSVTQTLEGEESQFDIKLTRCLPLSDLPEYLAGLDENSSDDEPYKLPRITGMTTFEDIQALADILRGEYCSGKYVDLSETTLPEGITDLSTAFMECTTMTAAPQIPAGVVNMSNCFAGCYALTTAPVIPDGVTNMDSCFQSCTSLTSAPVIPASVTDMTNCFYYCSSISGNLVIKANITDSSFFQGVCNSSSIGAVYVPNSDVKDALAAATGTGLSDDMIHFGTP